MSNVIKVVSAAVSHLGAVFYTETGDVKTIPITDPRISEMVDKVIEAVNNGKIVEVDLSTYSVFSEIEKESKGFLRFFRVAKKKLASILGISRDAAKRGNVNPGGFVQNAPEEAAPQPGTPDVTPDVKKALEKAHTQAMEQSLSDEDTTVVAVVGDTPIVGAEALTNHAKAAVVFGETIGFQNLMTRLSKVAKERKHTVQEALVFLKEMDLPFANDGSIIAYKSLTTTSENGIFKDNHSGSLKQGVGTLVQMDAELVDDNRRVLCSNGLHVARRGYLGGYGTGSGNVVCLIKIAPEDVISVPMGEQSKMRVRAYHIVAQLSDADMSAIKKQQSFTAENMDQASLLAKVIRGEHIGIINITTQHKGGKVDQMIPVENVNAPQIIGSIQKAHTVDAIAEQNELDVETINKKVTKKAEPVKKEQAADHSEAYILFKLWEANKTSAAWDSLMAFKAKKKKSWKALGLTAEQISIIESVSKPVSKTVAKPKVKSEPKPEVKPKVKKAPVKKVENQKQKVNQIITKGKSESKKAEVQVAKKNNPARTAFEIWQKNTTGANHQRILEAKKRQKKSWTALGFTSEEIKMITG